MTPEQLSLYKNNHRTIVMTGSHACLSCLLSHKLLILLSKMQLAFNEHEYVVLIQYYQRDILAVVEKKHSHLFCPIIMNFLVVCFYPSSAL